MSNRRKILKTLHKVYQLSDYEVGTGEMAGMGLRELSGFVSLDKKVQKANFHFVDIDGLVNNFKRDILAFLSNFTFSEEEFFIQLIIKSVRNDGWSSCRILRLTESFYLKL